MIQANSENGDVARLLKTPRLLCTGLGVFDFFLGGLAVFFPYVYGAIFHPDLDAPPVDYIVRTGILWLFFCAVELRAGAGTPSGRWIFLVACLRLMDVPADLAYGTLAIGARWWSRGMIYVAPVINLTVGIYLLRASRKVK